MADLAAQKKRGLGRGLGALLPKAAEARPVELRVPGETVPEYDRVLHLDPHALEPNPRQPRKAFSEEALQELAESIKRDGVQEPVIVRRRGNTHELVSGERRVRASIMAGRDTIPAICREVSDADMLKLGLIENIQREDLNPIELALAYQQLVDEFRWTQEQVADEVGKNRATVTNTLRLLNLPEEVQQYVVEGSLSMGHARALLALPTADAQRAAARRVITKGLSVRETEKLAAAGEAKPKRAPEKKDPNVADLEDELRRRFGAKVSVRSLRNRRGRIEIEYYNLDELERILAILRGTK